MTNNNNDNEDKMIVMVMNAKAKSITPAVDITQIVSLSMVSDIEGWFFICLKTCDRKAGFFHQLLTIRCQIA